MSAAAFIINLFGLKQCTKDGAYKKAINYILYMLAGLSICMSITLVVAFGGNTAIGRTTNGVAVLNLTVLLGIAAMVMLLVAEIRYIIFLKDSANAL